MRKLLCLLFIIPGCYAVFGQTNMKPSEVRLISENEPGKPFTLSITVLDIDTRKPVKNVEVFAYHTNYKGDYENNANGVARIHGTAWSDENGLIRFITIYPRGYNDSNTGEHIHCRVKAAGYAGGNTDLMFSDYYHKRYDFSNPTTNKVYLESLEEKTGHMSGKALIFVKRN